jgi:hypothetical protein
MVNDKKCIRDINGLFNVKKYILQARKKSITVSFFIEEIQPLLEYQNDQDYEHRTAVKLHGYSATPFEVFLPL